MSRAKRWVVLVWGVALALESVVPALATPPPPSRHVYAPYFVDQIPWEEMAIFWFGRVTPTENYADVRVGYNNQELYVHLNIFDRLLWYDTNPSPNALTAWDAVALYLDLNGNTGNTPDTNAYRFVAQLSVDETPRTSWQAAYRGNSADWALSAVPFTTTSYYRGSSGPNTGGNADGWFVSFSIPFASLGLSRPPAQGTAWGLALQLYDRDDAAGTPIPVKPWPEAMQPDRPATWGQLAFGLPTYTPPRAVAGGTVTIRHKLNGATVVDGAVGGGTVCGEGLDFWSQWGNTNYAAQTQFNIQNQIDVADWPCFSKYYVSFPLSAIPSGKVIISATLTLHQFGNSGQGWDPPPQPSLIQVLSVAEDWDKATLTWNNAPLAMENVASAWVDPLTQYPGEPGVPRTWDVSLAVAKAYMADLPLRLVLYSADSAIHSGKYFWSSDVDDFMAQKGAQPTLTIVWGQPSATVHKTVWPATSIAGQWVTYTLQVLGTGQALTLTDDLPAQVSPPGPISVAGGGTATYDSVIRRVTWTGTPTVGLPVTLTFPVTVLVSNPMVVRNTAVLDAAGDVYTDTVTLIVNALPVWLPLVLHD